VKGASTANTMNALEHFASGAYKTIKLIVVFPLRKATRRDPPLHLLEASML
jgi:hypothetical protein